MNNNQDDFIVAILKSSIINGHVPQQTVINTPQHVANKCSVSKKSKSTFLNKRSTVYSMVMIEIFKKTLTMAFGKLLM